MTEERAEYHAGESPEPAKPTTIKPTHINLWFGGGWVDGGKCFEMTPAIADDTGEIYLSLSTVQRLLEYQWPADRWAVQYQIAAGRACFQCETGRMVRTNDPEPGWKCTTCDTLLPDDQTTARPRSFIRVKLGSSTAAWRSVELLEIGMGGGVRVADENGPIWVPSEHIHPDDRAAIRRRI